MTSDAILDKFGITGQQSGVWCGEWLAGEGGQLVSINPSTGKPLGVVRQASRREYDQVVERAAEAFRLWRRVPAPKRGEVVRQLGEALRRYKRDLGYLITLEAGKIRSEAEGEVQEMIDMCDFAVGLSRQLYGLTIASERPNHRLFEQWHPLGVIGIITAFNFPVAVWSWNAALAAVCGDAMIWKPSQLTPLAAVAVQRIIEQVVGDEPWKAIFSLCVGTGQDVGTWMADDPRLPLISATGSCAMGRALAQRVAARLGRSLLELGGNNGVIIAPSANLELALRAVTFAAVGTAGQRCTTLRRLFVHESIFESFVARLVEAYRSIRIGNPWEEGVLMGPLIRQEAVAAMLEAVQTACRQGAKLLYGGKALERDGYFVEPAIVQATPQMPIVSQETFAPILYVMAYREWDEVIRWHNAVPQGLSSAVFTRDLQEAERFLSVEGSDCGIANVNIGTSGAEIGGAFGGEKETGGGREAGSDAWKAYMRRQTCTVNFGDELPLAQGIRWGNAGQ
ncbi:MAG: aldehyde dehydrogenase [Pirellulaceae bacterium]|nr:MAG: aldehyde dehydrogenase [Pirellulaceae bacterium]